MLHRHDFRYNGIKVLPSPLVRHRLCVDVYKCTKCDKCKYGAIRETTKEEILEMANKYKEHLEGRR